MKSETVQIILPLPSRVLNPNFHIASSRGAMMKAAATRKQRRLSLRAVEDEFIESAPWGRVKVSARFYYAVKRERDHDNAIASLKSTYDGIVDSELIEDDTPEYMERIMPEFFIDKENPRLELTLERLS